MSSETKTVYYTNSNAGCECECRSECTCDYTWEDAVWELSQHLHKLVGRKKNLGNYRWHVTVTNFGWQGLSGYKDMKSSFDAERLLCGILPDTQCTFRFGICDSKQVEIFNAHHDRPQGDERYVITLEKVGANG